LTAHRGAESDFELTVIERLEALRYRHIQGQHLDRPIDEVVLRDRLRAFLVKQYPKLPASSLDQAVALLAKPEGADTLRRNMAFHTALTRGAEVRVEHTDGTVEYRHVHAVDWDRPDENDFLVVNQLPVHGQNDRRPDLVVFVNGLPLVLFELKNPWDKHPTVEGALNQIGHYKYDIPQVFEFNALTVVSDGVKTLHGMWTATPEWFAPWKSIDGFHDEAKVTGTMKTLIEGLFPKDRLLAYVRNFIVFEVVNEQITKKGAKYHQFFAVRLAVEKAVTACQAGADRRIGVIWHTTGSGKSLSMAFLVGMLRRRPELGNPTFVVQVDRTDLDNQLHDQFVAARSLVGDVKHAEGVAELRELLRTEGGEVIFTTVEKFRLGEDELRHPRLSERSNIVVIADEAHRSQYGFEKGYARYLADALPNARRIGFTGTPVSFGGADTVEVFGDLIHTYDIQQSQEDRATVPIHYEPRQVRLQLSHEDVDAALDDILQGEGVGARDRGRWAALAAAAGARDRLERLAQDLLAHFRQRTATLEGKALIVCMTRENCVRLYDALKAQPECPEMKIVMTGDLTRDPPEWTRAGHITTKFQREAIKKRLVDPDDPLTMVIVCDMWLTGTDIPCLHTLYVDKPMKGHTIIQAISRVNRVFRDKPHGLVVDYIGIGEELREATRTYTAGGGRGDPAPPLDEQAVPAFRQALEAVRAALPALPPGQRYGEWRQLSRIEYDDRCSALLAYLIEADERRDAFLEAERRLTQGFLLVKHLDPCRPFADEVVFYQRARAQVEKTIPGRRPPKDVEKAVRDLVDDAVETDGVVDIFTLAGIERADVSILDDKFLQTFKDRPLPNLRLKLLEKLLSEEIEVRRRRNLVQARSFRELLEATLRRYHARLIDAAAVIEAMLRIKKEMDTSDQRAAELGLAADELAFYDSVAANRDQVYEVAFLRDLVHDVVQTIKRNLKVGWTEAHRDDVRAEVRAAVRRVLHRRGVKAEDFEPLLGAVMEQAEALYADWPSAA
jgi:type I restriction enzyme R subunit